MVTIAEGLAELLEHTAVIAGRLVAAAAPLFAPPKELGPAGRAAGALFPEGPPPAAPAAPVADEAAGGLRDGAEQAGQGYGGDVTGAAMTDDKLRELLQRIFAKNAAAGDTVQTILADIQAKARQVGPELADPAALMTFHHYLDQKFGQLQGLLDDSRVDAETQAAILRALGSEYRANSPDGDGDGAWQGAGGGESGQGYGGLSDGGPAAGGGEGGSDGASAGVGGGPVGEGPGGGGGLIDPLAGIGLGGPAGLDPMAAMMGPAMAGLGALPGGLNGLGGLGGGGLGLGLDGLAPALGSLIPALRDSGLAAPGPEGADGFADNAAAKAEPRPQGEQFGDSAEGAESTPEPQPAPPPQFGDGADDGATQDKPVGGAPLAAEAGAPLPAAPAAGSGLAPAGQDGRTVALPDGTAVSAPSDQRAAAMRAVLAGSTVTAAYDGNVPPPGSPVLSPVSRNELEPGDYAQFATRGPVMYMGQNRIWMDGQIQPIGALGSSPDFLGWCQPPAGGGHNQQAAALPSPPAPAATPAGN